MESSARSTRMRDSGLPNASTVTVVPTIRLGQVAPRASLTDVQPESLSPPTETRQLLPAERASQNKLFGCNHLMPYRSRKLDVFLLGITIVISGQYVGWNSGFSAGIYGYLVAYVVVGLAFIILCCCMSEVSSVLPFAGGSYGIARCTLGFYPAFLIGCCETLEYIAAVATITVNLVKLTITFMPSLNDVQPVLCLFVYMTSLYAHVVGNRVFWQLNAVVGIFTLIFLVVYCVGALPYSSLEAKPIVDGGATFTNGFMGLVQTFPSAAWFFLGVEALNFACDDLEHPKRDIPLAQVPCIMTLFVTGIAVVLVTLSLPFDGLGELQNATVPLNKGFQLMFGTDSNAVTLLSLPSLYGAIFGLMWGYGKLLHAMASSRLLPEVLTRLSRRHGTQSISLVFGSAVSYLLCLVMFYYPDITGDIFSVCLMFAFMSYAGQCIGYVSLRLKYKELRSSKFRSPFGIVGAVYAALVWVLGIISIASFQNNNGKELVIFNSVAVGLTIFYFAYAKNRQILSDQERRVLLIAHVLRIQSQRKRRQRQQSKQVGKDGTPANLMSPMAEGESTRQSQKNSLNQVIKPTMAAITAPMRDAGVVPTTPLHQVLPVGVPHAACGYTPGKIDVWLLGITIVIGGQYFGWNLGLAAGVMSFATSFLIITAGFVLFCCSAAEVTGALPFAGGAYGLARCTLGFYPGFLIGCCDALEYTACVATTMTSLVGLLVQMVPKCYGYEPLVGLLLYILALAVQVRGSRAFWLCNKVIGIASIGILLVFGFGNLAHIDVARSPLHNRNDYFLNGTAGVVRMLPYAAWFYGGIESLNLAGNDMPSPTTTIPVAQVACVLTLFGTGALTLFVVVALPLSGSIHDLSADLAVLNPGFQLLLGVSSRVATLLSIPATYGVACGFMWSSSKLIYSMALSGLLPPVFTRLSGSYGTSYVAMMVGALISYGLCLWVFYDPVVGNDMLLVCMLAAFLSYAGQCVGYVAFKVLYPELAQSKFPSPFGIGGAIVSLLVWIIGIVSIVGFQERSAAVTTGTAVVIGLVSAFYVGYARKRQRFSPDERSVLMIAHVAKVNRSNVRRDSIQQRSVNGSTTTASAKRRSTVYGTEADAKGNSSEEDGDSSRHAQRKGTKVQPEQTVMLPTATATVTNSTWGASTKASIMSKGSSG
ncbi:TPA: hypothetical protein N0F65_006040 [Lagenidium giganteum]|uniref:Amino acid permease/ SLC12A domain-containing protein n=1 Tax=Lagenidium giganteum TaxID=4803 RepID=A0AAV2Z8C0_9STRA|nr:TPA: hypothetical protein N0F65_006040 [Lagenidium giganteum]